MSTGFFVSALNSVDLPTFGSPTMPMENDILDSFFEMLIIYPAALGFPVSSPIPTQTFHQGDEGVVAGQGSRGIFVINSFLRQSEDLTHILIVSYVDILNGIDIERQTRGVFRHSVGAHDEPVVVARRIVVIARDHIIPCIFFIAYRYDVVSCNDNNSSG